MRSDSAGDRMTVTLENEAKQLSESLSYSSDTCCRDASIMIDRLLAALDVKGREIEGFIREMDMALAEIAGRHLAAQSDGDPMGLLKCAERLRDEWSNMDQFVSKILSDKSDDRGDHALLAYRVSAGAWLMLQARIRHVIDALPLSPSTETE